MHSRGCFQQTTHGETEEVTASTHHMMQCMQRLLQQGRKGANGGGGGVRTEQNKVKKYECKVRCYRARSGLSTFLRK